MNINPRLVTNDQTSWRDRNPEQYKRIRNAWYEKNKEKHKAQMRINAYRDKYGITPEHYDKLFARQNGVCFICHEPQLAGKRLCIDHHHVTGEVRGLLCTKCNVLICTIDKDPDTLTRLVVYLGGK